MPALKLKFIVISAALLLGFSPLFANEDRLEDREAPAVQDWVRDDAGNGGPPAVSDAESDQPERPVDASTDAYGDDAAGDPGRNRPAGAIKAPGFAARDEDGTPAPGPKLSETSEKNDAKAPTGEKASGASENGAAKTTGTVATNPSKVPVAKAPAAESQAAQRDSQDNSAKVSASKNDQRHEVAGGAGDTRAAGTRATVENPDGGNTLAKETGGLSGAEKRIPDDGGEADQAVPDHQEAEISRDDPMDRDEDRNQDRKAGASRRNKRVRKRAVGETVVGGTAAEAPKSRRRLFYGKIGSTGD
ncbi:MAG: hypothetical protein V3S64_04245, partial [bacterium]